MSFREWKGTTGPCSYNLDAIFLSLPEAGGAFILLLPRLFRGPKISGYIYLPDPSLLTCTPVLPLCVIPVLCVPPKPSLDINSSPLGT